MLKGDIGRAYGCGGKGIVEDRPPVARCLFHLSLLVHDPEEIPHRQRLLFLGMTVGVDSISPVWS